MSQPELDNLVRIGQLKAEPRNTQEVNRMLSMARSRLNDAQLSNLSLEGRFTSAYNAAHSAALAALRWHGYRSENRYTVFQCLTHTLDLAEYEGYLDVEESTVAEMCTLVQGLILDVQRLVVK